MLQPPQNIVFPDLVSFLSFELDQPSEVVRRALWADPAGLPALLEEIGRSELFQWNPTVAEPIFHGPSSRGAALIEANIPLQPDYLARLVERQVKSADTPIGPISMELTSGLLFHYRERISRKMGALLTEVRRSARGGVAGIHRLLSVSPELGCVQEVFEEIVAGLLSNPRMLQTMILAFSENEAGTGLKKGVNTAFVAMSVLAQCSRSVSTDAKKRKLIEIGMAAVLQDISLLSEESLPPEDHPELSAQIASQRGAQENVASLIRLHHTLKAADGSPVLRNGDALSLEARALVVTNTYLDLVDQNLYGGTVELIKRLNHLASEKYIDADAVRVLSRMCLPNIKSSLVDGANEIALSCVQRNKCAIPWPVVGDRIPAVLICKSESCMHRASQTISVTKTIPFIVDDKLLATIPSGDYRVCSLLSVRLRNLYTSVQAQISQQQ